MANNIYLGNPNLKAKNVPIPFTQEQINEYILCKDDPIHFIRNYCRIVSLDQGLINFELFDYQIRFINTIHTSNRVISMQPRQSGKCVFSKTKVKLKQKSTGNIIEVALGEFYAWCRFKEVGTIEDLCGVNN